MTATEFETAPVPIFDAVTVKYSPAREVQVTSSVLADVGDAWIVYGGEYPEDCADVLVVVEHAVDEDGGDIREAVARAIAGVLGGTQ